MTHDQVHELFTYEHLPTELAMASEPFHSLAMNIHQNVTICEEQTLALRKLWEAKNLVVWIAANG